jgi:hypothetical protein
MYKDEVTGEVYEIVGRDVETNGTREGAQIKDVAKKHNRIELKLPRKPSRFTQEPDDDYMLSINPDLENGAAPVQTVTQTSSFLKKRQPQVQKPTADFDFDAETAPADPPVQVQQPAPVQKKPASGSMKLEAKTLTMDLDKLPATNVCIKTATGSETISLEELRKRLAISSEDVEKLKTEAAQKLPFDRCIEEEDVLIKNMIDKSKKKNAKITLAVSIPLPPKEVYETIKDVYEEGMADEFVRSVTARISMDKLLESLSEGMKKFYEGSSTKTSENANK